MSNNNNKKETLAAIGGGKPNLDQMYEKLIKTGDAMMADAESGKLTEEQVKELGKIIDNASKANENLRVLSELPSNNGVSVHPAVAVSEDAIKKDVTIAVDPITGASNIIGPAEGNTGSDEKFNLDEYLDMDKYDKDKIEISERTIDFSEAQSEYGLTKNEMIALIPVMKRVQAKEPFDIYTEIGHASKKLAHTIDAIVKGSDISKESISVDIINELITDVCVKSFTVDVNELIDKEIKNAAPDLSGMYETMVKTKKEQLLKIADNIDAEDHNKAEQLRQIAEACEESYTYAGFKDALINHKIKIKKYEIERPDKVFNDFCFKYQDTALAINNVKDITYCIPRHLKESTIAPAEGVTTDTVYAFAVAFCKYCMNYKPSNNYQHMFMYYFIRNILAMDIVGSGEQVSEFYTELITNVVDCMNIIHEKYGY